MAGYFLIQTAKCRALKQIWPFSDVIALPKCYEGTRGGLHHCICVMIVCLSACRVLSFPQNLSQVAILKILSCLFHAFPRRITVIAGAIIFINMHLAFLNTRNVKVAILHDYIHLQEDNTVEEAILRS